MIHFSNKKFGFTIFIFLFLLCCTQEETNFHKQDNEKKEIESFFEISQIKSRSDNKHNDLVDIIKQCLLKQENIIGYYTNISLIISFNSKSSSSP